MTSVPVSCIIDDCDVAVYCKAMCRRHYSLDYNSRNREKKRQRDREWRAANRDAVNERKRARYPERKDTILAAQKIYYQETAEEQRAKRKLHYAANKDSYKERAAEWAVDNPERRLEILRESAARHPETKERSSRKRRAMTYDAFVESFTAEDVVALYGTLCHLCQEEIDLAAPRASGREGWRRGLHIDHVTSLVNGGAHSLENVRPAHGECNLRKGRG